MLKNFLSHFLVYDVPVYFMYLCFYFNITFQYLTKLTNKKLFQHSKKETDKSLAE